MRPTELGVALITVLSLAGCAQEPDAEQTRPDERGFEWQAIGKDPEGCERFIKKPIREGVMVDQAIYYRDAEGNYTVDRQACAPTTDRGEQ